MGFDNRSFYFLLKLFEPLRNKCTPYSHDGQIRLFGPTRHVGRPRNMTATHCLGLILTWNRTRDAKFALCMSHGITGSVFSIFLRFARRILLKEFKKHPLSVISMSSGQEIAEHQRDFTQNNLCYEVCSVVLTD